jgi:uncharacterized OB-fold protein
MTNEQPHADASHDALNWQAICEQLERGCRCDLCGRIAVPQQFFCSNCLTPERIRPEVDQ